MEQQKLYLCFIIVIIGLIFWYHQSTKTKESFDSFKAISYKHYLPNQNSFKNYYRIGYEMSQNMGWKPTETWDHLRPEYNEAPTCFRKDPIYAN